MRSLKISALFCCLFLSAPFVDGQSIQDDFEGNGNITTWFGDNCGLNTALSNPFVQGSNTSSTVLEYHDTGALYANIRFDAGRNLNTASYSSFSFKIYVPSNGLTGNQNNQVSLKLQDGSLGAPWTTQCEIIKPIVLNQWQTVSFDFATDPYVNFDAASLAPTQRSDFNRVLIQINGENNTDHVLAYIDDFFYYDSLIPPPVFDQLVWSDEFNGSGAIDNSKWFHQTQLPNGNSWYNGEIQHYTNRTVNSYQSNGVLNLVAKNESFTDQGHTKQFTSARLNSKFAFTYGRVEIRAKMPTGAGTWPAIWMLGKNISEPGAYWQTQGFGTTGWPACGEIDIMEHWGNNQNYVSSATHTPSSFGGTVNVGGRILSTISNNFHLYVLEWTQDQLVFSIDSVVHYTYNPTVKNASTWPFDTDQYLLLNIAMQGNTPSSFTQSAMEVDYVRVYQQSTVGIQETSTSSTPLFFPNPVENELSVLLKDSKSETITVQLYQLNGQLVQERLLSNEGGTLRIDQLERLPQGMYLISFQHLQQPYRFKFIKN